MIDGISKLDPGAARFAASGGSSRGGSSGRGTEYLLIGSLAVVILGSIAVTIYVAIGGAKDKPGKPMAECENCNERFEYDLGKDPRAMGLGLGGGPPDMHVEMYKPDCPKCGQKETGLPLIECPKCKEYFMSPNVEYERAIEAGDDPGPLPALVCPKCGTDRQEWIIEKNRKRRKK